MIENNRLLEPVNLKRVHKNALLLVTFGSTHEGPHATFADIRKTFETAFPDKDVFMAFTSRICIKRWAAKTGQQYHTPNAWLEAFGPAGYEQVFIQSLHVIPGLEYSFLTKKYIPQFTAQYPDIPVTLGEPLLWDDADIQRVGDALLDIFDEPLSKGECLVLMGHGNSSDAYPEANNKYQQLNAYLQARNPRVVIGTVDYEAMLYDFVLDYLQQHVDANAVVNLSPLMSIAGDHAVNDMAADFDPEEPEEEQSWLVRLANAGYQVDKAKCHLRGLADYPQIRNIWVEHLKNHFK